MLLADEATTEALRTLRANRELMEPLAELRARLSAQRLSPAYVSSVAARAYWFHGNDKAKAALEGDAPMRSQALVNPRAAGADLIVLLVAAPTLADLKTQAPHWFRGGATVFPETLREAAPVVTLIWQAGRWYWNPFGW